ncbi:carbohydrate esterase family 9 protein [Schizophyllum amplum]|uniref:Carbohydrate esterase family 9 protein n=1 Tax=Schizophyllum amplum TaxID=97359 RepID=A0A550CWE2_9AGAR|nr:carbohydrate esterase family 9 protein [Auriculariopsis ampla]
MSSSNGLICFTNCLLPLEDGSIVERDLWIDERRGVIVDAQKTFFLRKERPAKVIDLEGNILSPGFMDIQINGAYGFDFSVYEGDDQVYSDGLRTVAEKIVETGVTSLLPTTITQEKSLYPKLLNLLRPYSSPNSATLLGWHAEGPFIQYAKRGAHAPSFLLSAPNSMDSFKEVYGAENLADAEDWLMSDTHERGLGIRVITAAPEVDGVMSTIGPLAKSGVVFSIGHSIASSAKALEAVQKGARLITHLFNAMPQLHHRDPAIIGLLGASPHLATPFHPITAQTPIVSRFGHELYRAPSLKGQHAVPSGSEALGDVDTPPMSPVRQPAAAPAMSGVASPLDLGYEEGHGHMTTEPFQRPFYELIVDGIHSHPNSVRLAYTAYPEGCILITDAMKILDPSLKDGVHEWRDGQKFVKEGDKLYLEGTDTLAGSVVTLDKCVRNFVRFTGCSLGDAIKCATYNPAKCLGIENRKGTLRPGADADFVVLDRLGNVLHTWVGGKQVWSKQ